MVTKSITSDLRTRRGAFRGETRSIIPPSPELDAWDLRKDEAEVPSFEEIHKDWYESLLDLKKTANSNLYERVDALTHGDLWMHRLLVTQSIMEIQLHILSNFGEVFAGKEIDTPLPKLLAEVENEITELVDTLHEWHGSPQSQDGVPEEFINSMVDAVNGNVEDFDEGLHARSGGTK